MAFSFQSTDSHKPPPELHRTSKAQGSHCSCGLSWAILWRSGLCLHFPAFSFFTLAHLAFCAAMILARPSALIFLFLRGFTVSTSKLIPLAGLPLLPFVGASEVNPAPNNEDNSAFNASMRSVKTMACFRLLVSIMGKQCRDSKCVGQAHENCMHFLIIWKLIVQQKSELLVCEELTVICLTFPLFFWLVHEICP